LNGNWMSVEDELAEGNQLAAHTLTPIPVPTPESFDAPRESARYQRTYVLRIQGLRLERPLSLWLNLTIQVFDYGWRFLAFGRSALPWPIRHQGSC
jgi:hypothetical protein